eukprot:g4136.t1
MRAADPSAASRSPLPSKPEAQLIVEAFPPSKPEAQLIVEAFLAAQDARDLDLMCSLVSEDVVYVNEPHPAERDILGKLQFRRAFAASPCIWADDAKLEIKRISCAEGSDTVFTERLDQYLIARGDGQEPAWLQIPICGFFVADTSAKSIVYWKDYFDYRKYKEQYMPFLKK